MTLPFDQTLGLSHPFSVGKNVHSILGNPNASGTFYADIPARDADTDFQVLENVGKAVAITSPLSIFVLMTVGPAVWLELSSTLSDSFLELTDTPSSYSGQSLQGVRVNAGETGLEFHDSADTFLELIDTPSSYSGEALKVVSVNAAETGLEFTTNAAGDVFGPGSSTDNALARFDLATGKLIQNSLGILNDFGELSGLTKFELDNLRLDGNTLSTLLGDLLLAPTTALIDVSTSKIQNLVDPTADQDAATKKYVDDQILTQDTFLELTDTPSSYASAANQVVAVNNAETGLKFTPMTVLDNGQVLIDSDLNVPLVVQMNGTSGNPSYIEFKDTINRLRMGYLSTDFSFTSIAQAQIGATINGGCVYATRGDFAGGGHTFLTPNAALDTLVARVTIGDDPGHVGIGRLPDPTDLLCVREPTDSTDSFIGVGDQIVRLRLGQRLGAPPTSTNAAEIVTDGQGNLTLKARSTSADSILLYTGLTNSIHRMAVQGDGTISIWNGSTAGTGQLTIGTGTAVAGASLTIENSTALMCGQLIGASGKWQIKTVSGVVQFGAVQPTALGLLTNNIIRTRWDQIDGRIRNLFGQTSKKRNIADADTTILSSDYRIATTSITAARVYTIPSAEIAKGSATEAREWKFKDESGNVGVANKITIVTEGSETIDGATDLVVTTPFHDFSLYADGSNVFVEAA